MQGYILGTVFAAVELWWLSIVFVLLIEVYQQSEFQKKVLKKTADLGWPGALHEGQPGADGRHLLRPL